MPDTSRPVVVITDDTIHPSAVQRLAERCDVRVLPGTYPDAETLAAASQDADAILARLSNVGASVIAAAPKLRIIARHGSGVDTVDLDAATARGILVTTTGTINASTVAEYTFALLLALVRKVPTADAGMRAGGWNREPLRGMALAGKSLGVLGLGAIGRRVARQANGFGMKVLARRSASPVPKEMEVELVPFDQLLARSDILCVCLRLSRETRHIIDRASISRMKKGAFIVNTARGEIIDEAGLIDALRTGHLGGAALDVFEQEPLPDTSPLRSMANVVLSPHVAGQTHEAAKSVGLAAADAILDALDGKIPQNVYNRDVLRHPAWADPRA